MVADRLRRRQRASAPLPFVVKVAGTKDPIAVSPFAWHEGVPQPGDVVVLAELSFDRIGVERLADAAELAGERHRRPAPAVKPQVRVSAGCAQPLLRRPVAARVVQDVEPPRLLVDRQPAAPRGGIARSAISRAPAT